MEPIVFSKFLQVLRDGASAYVACPAGDAARVIPPIIEIENEGGKVSRYVMYVEEERQPCGKSIINFPGGRVNKGEGALIDTIKRELQEETGLDVDISAIEKLTLSALKDASLSEEKEALFICPNPIRIKSTDGNTDLLLKGLYSNQNLDEYEECKIKLVKVEDLKSFIASTDMCLPTRLASLYLLTRLKQNYNVEYNENVVRNADNHSKVESEIDNVVVKQVEGNSFPYFFYSSKQGNQVALFTKLKCGNKHYYILQKQNVLNGQDCYSMPEQYVGNETSVEVAEKTVNEMVKTKLGLSQAEVTQLTPFDAISPGITDVRQSIYMAEAIVSKEQLKSLAQEGYTILPEDKIPEALNSNLGYSTMLVLKTEQLIKTQARNYDREQ